MAALAWTMMGIALWHFSIFVPDRFAGGIVGAFVGAALGAVIFGWIVHGFTVPGNDDLTLLNAIEAIPGALLGMGLVYLLGVRRERAAGDSAAVPRVADRIA